MIKIYQAQFNSTEEEPAVTAVISAGEFHVSHLRSACHCRRFRRRA
jgi:hypothetical protein